MAGGFNWKKEGQRRQIERYGSENAESLETAAGPGRGRTREGTGRPAADTNILDKVAARYAARPKIRRAATGAPVPPAPSKRKRKDAKLRSRSLEFVESYLRALARGRQASMPRVVEEDIRAAGGFDAWCTGKADREQIAGRVSADLGIPESDVRWMMSKSFPGRAKTASPGLVSAPARSEPRPPPVSAPGLAPSKPTPTQVASRPINAPVSGHSRRLGPLDVPGEALAQIDRLASQSGSSRETVAVRLLLRGLATVRALDGT